MASKPQEREVLRSAAKAAIQSNGDSIKEWAATRNLDYQAVIDVLHGRRQGRYGKCFKAAVALGLKPAPSLANQASK